MSAIYWYEFRIVRRTWKVCGCVLSRVLLTNDGELMPWQSQRRRSVLLSSVMLVSRTCQRICTLILIRCRCREGSEVLSICEGMGCRHDCCMTSCKCFQEDQKIKMSQLVRLRRESWVISVTTCAVCKETHLVWQCGLWQCGIASDRECKECVFTIRNSVYSQFITRIDT